MTTKSSKPKKVSEARSIYSRCEGAYPSPEAISELGGCLRALALRRKRHDFALLATT